MDTPVERALPLPVSEWEQFLDEARDIAREVGFWCREMNDPHPFDPNRLVESFHLYRRVPVTPWLGTKGGPAGATLGALVAAIVGSSKFQRHSQKIENNGGPHR